MILNQPKIKHLLEELHKDFVFVPTDKASNNIAIVCKKFYVEKSMQELNIFLKSDIKNKDYSTYVMIDKDIKSVINRHNQYIKSKIQIDEDIPEDIPFLYWIPKMHKKPFSKQRYVAASHCCSTKPLSALLTKCFALIEKEHRKICHRYKKHMALILCG